MLPGQVGGPHPRKLYFAVFGSGLGHAARGVSLGELLRGRGYRCLFSSSGQALSYLTAHGEREVVRSPPLDVEWTEAGGFSASQFLPRFQFMFNSFLKQVAFEEKSIAKFDPRLVVSDSRLSAVFAARAKSYPVVTILNQFKVAFPPRFRGKVGRLYERFAGDVLGLLWSLSDQVLMTDLPPPYTIAEANIVGTDVSNIAQFVGFTSPVPEISEDRLKKTKASLGIDSRPLVFCQISGPDATKKWFLETSLQAAKDLSREYNVVISAGRAGGSQEPSRLANGALLFEWCPIKDELFEMADLLVARAGHGTIGQCIGAGKPAVLVPIHNHPEQMGNADKFQRLGLGLQIRSEKLSAGRLVESVQLCLADSKFKNSVEALREFSKKYNGLERCAEVIGSYS